MGIKSMNPTGSSQPTNKLVKHDPANHSTSRSVGLFRTFPLRTYITWSSGRLFPFRLKVRPRLIDKVMLVVYRLLAGVRLVVLVYLVFTRMPKYVVVLFKKLGQGC